MIFAWLMFILHFIGIVAMIVENEKVNGKFAFTDKENCSRLNERKCTA